MAENAKWYVVHTYSGYENKVATNIETVVENRKMHDQILEVSVPTETVTEIREDGTKKEVERKIFPGYVLVKFAVFENEDTDEVKMTDDAWYVVRNTRGVTGFVLPPGDGVQLPLEGRQLFFRQLLDGLGFSVDMGNAVAQFQQHGLAVHNGDAHLHGYVLFRKSCVCPGASVWRQYWQTCAPVSSAQGHGPPVVRAVPGGKETPLSLLSMPVASCVATGTACGRLRSRLAHKGPSLSAGKAFP